MLTSSDCLRGLWLLMILVAGLCDGPAKGQEGAKPLPTEAEIAAATSTVQEIYQADFKAATTSAAKLDVARKLLKDGQATQDDRAGKFVLLRTARDAAAAGGDIPLAYQVIDQLASDFAIKPLNFRAEAVIKAAPAIDSPLAYDRALRQFYLLSEQALLADDYPLADQLADGAIALAKRVKDAGLTKLWAARQRELQQVAAEHARLGEALATLAKEPADAVANLAVGKFRCLRQNDWTRGVPLLALGNDAALAAVAAQELQQKTLPLDLAEAWWKVSEGATGPAQTFMQRHAATFYAQAVPKLSGLARSRVEQRLKQACALQVPLDERASGFAARPLIDCAPKHFQVALGRTFDLSQSWTLHVEFYTEQALDHPKTIVIWGDSRPGHDVLAVVLTSDHLATLWQDAVANTNESFEVKFAAPPTGQWWNVKLRFDALTRTMKLYLNEVLVAERERQILPRADRAMPLIIGGDSPAYRFTGKLRELWFGNH